MGKKSKRTRASGGGGGGGGGGKGQQIQQKKPHERKTVIDHDDDRARAAPALRGKQEEEEEETADNLRFEDPFIDEYESEEEDEAEEEMHMDDDDGDDGGGGKPRAASSSSSAAEQQPQGGESQIKSWNPLSSEYQPGVNEQLEINDAAYKMHHTLTPEWPSLTLDVIRDNLGDHRTRFPHSVILAVGSQADRPERNKLTLLKLSDLARTGGKDKTEQELDDEMLGEEYRGNNDSDDDSDDDSDEEVEEEDLDPVLEHYSLPHPSGGINRIRACPQNPSVVSVWGEAGTVSLYDCSGVLDAFDRSSGGGGGGGASSMRKMKKDPFFIYSGHSTEGYAMDWSRVDAGKLVTGDCDGNVHVWSPVHPVVASSAGGGGNASPDWTTSSFDVVPSYSAHGANLDNPSVEDVQWSPTEGTVLATAECGGYVRIYDTRCKGRSMLSNKIHDNGSDVNVIGWNGLVTNLLASGSDDGVFSVWDLRNFQLTNGNTPKPLARFTSHKTPINSLEWHPTDESMIAVSDDLGTYVYDLSVEEDDPEQQGEEGQNKAAGGRNDDVDGIPPQLLFVHSGSEMTKEVHWHPQIPSCIATTALSGFSVFIPSNL